MREVTVERRELEPARTTRRRSWGGLLRNPLSTRSQDYLSISRSKPVGSVPIDVIREIVDLLSPPDILSFSLTSSGLRQLLLPALYESVTLRSSRKCRLTLKMLSERPEICAHIRKFAVRPNYYLAWPKPDEPLSEDWVAWKIKQMAPHLTVLDTFDWDGSEVPMDCLWGTLRNSCPELRSIFCNVGNRPLDPSSQLFEFSNLECFSLVVRYGLSGTGSSSFSSIQRTMSDNNGGFIDLFPPPEELPEQFWDMILNRCPNLEELALCSFSSCTRIFDFTRVTEGHWPKLHSLTLGAFGYQSDFSLGPTEESAMSSFLDAHPSLKFMRLQWNFKRWMSPAEIPMNLPPTALPALDTFIGIYQQLVGLPNPESIEALDLTCEPLHETRVYDVSEVLRSLTSLKTLDLWAHVLEPSHNHTHLFYQVLYACPKLTDFHFMCTTSFSSKPLKQLLSQLHLLPDLKRFSLTKGHQYRDESMLDTALQVLGSFPALKQINIRWAREKSPNHLKQEGSYDIDHDEEGRPVALMVMEKGIPLMGKPFYRRYRHEVKEEGWTKRIRHRLLRE